MFAGIFAAIANAVGGVASVIAGKLFNNLGRTAEHIAALKWSLMNAKTDRQRIDAEEQVKTLEAKRDVLVAESVTPWNAIARGLFVAPIALYYSKLWVWDKMLDLGSTEPPSDEMNWIARIVISFYFVGEISKIWKR